MLAAVKNKPPVADGPFLTAAARDGVDWPQAGTEERRFSRTEELDGCRWGKRAGVSCTIIMALAVALHP